MVAEYEAAAGLLAQLQALGAGPLWPYEAASLASPRIPSERALAASVRLLPRRPYCCMAATHQDTAGCHARNAEVVHRHRVGELGLQRALEAKRSIQVLL